MRPLARNRDIQYFLPKDEGIKHTVLISFTSLACTARPSPPDQAMVIALEHKQPQSLYTQNNASDTVCCGIELKITY